ncbi:hypothetical protein FOA52_010213 [Chlamydomonas sp. UWO 241]|nr:hypothetical protein FOA52_010213 [Chlamydomonas sp. UWO 241]
MEAESRRVDPRGRCLSHRAGLPRGAAPRFIGVHWEPRKSRWVTKLWVTQAKHNRYIGCYASEEDAARAFDFTAFQEYGPSAKRNFPDEVIREPPEAVGRQSKQEHASSRFIGVCWNKIKSSWCVRVRDPQTKSGARCVGYFTSEQDAARAYDWAVVQAHGPTAKRNFPDEVISELPVTVAGEQRQRGQSRYTGVSFVKAKANWTVSMWDSQTKRERHIGSYASEEDAARAYDYAAVQARGPTAKRNFPDEINSEPPVTAGEQRKQRSTSRFIGVSWNKAKSVWRVALLDPQTKRRRHVGSYASEEDAARAYDWASVQARGPTAERNFAGRGQEGRKVGAKNKTPERPAEAAKKGTKAVTVRWLAGGMPAKPPPSECSKPPSNAGAAAREVVPTGKEEWLEALEEEWLGVREETGPEAKVKEGLGAREEE